MIPNVTRRTSMNLDFALVTEAAEALGTTRTTDTVHAALREAIARARRAKLAARDFPALTPERLAEVRQPRAES